MLSENPLVTQVREYNREAGGSDKSRLDFVRAVIESEYRGLCDVRALVQETDGAGIVRTSEEIVLRDQPCRLSFENLKITEQTETAGKISQRAKLFISPDIKIRTGSVITVKQDGMEREYAMSGVPAVYPTHQEIMLKTAAEYSGEGDE